MTVVELRQSRKTKKALTTSKQGDSKRPFQINPNITGITKQQDKTIELWNKGKNLILHGMPGTGKTFLALLLSLREIEKPDSIYEKVYIVRSTVPTRDMGFLKGDHKEKMEVYEDPYIKICKDLYGRGDAYQNLKNTDKIEFLSTSYLRGTTFDKCIVIVDETQNLNFHECDTIITRLGNNAKIVFSGDFNQTDLTKEKDKRGFVELLSCVKEDSGLGFVEFGVDESVRSDFVRQQLIIKRKRGLI